MKQLPQVADTLGLIAGFAIWSSAFVMLYALHGGVCGAGIGSDNAREYLRAILLAIFVVHILAHGALIWWFVRRLRSASARPVRFLRAASLILAVAAIGATVWTSAPILFLRMC